MNPHPVFTETDLDRIAALIRANNFGVLVNRLDDSMAATHLPFTVRREGDSLVLEGHLAAANPQCACVGGAESLAIFSGPHAYISPSWYRTQPSVPTWDYVAAHIHGRLEPIENTEETDELMRQLGAHDTDGFSHDALPADYRARMLRGVRPFRLRSRRIEAQWKLSQNRSVTDRLNVIAALRSEGNQALADLIAATLPENA